MTTLLGVEFKDHDKVVLTNASGDTYTSKSEELMDFLHGANKIFSNPMLSDELNRLRLGRTRRAVEKCTEWLTYCLSIGWSKEEIDALEMIWWKYRDENGNLKAV